MADNITVTQGSGVTIRTDDVGGVQYAVTKLSLGADGAHDILVDSGQQTMANSLPVVLASDQTDVKITLDGEAVVLGAGSAAIGSVTVTAVVPGVAATSLGKAEDAAHASGDTGVQLLAVRQSSPANLSDTNGDYEPLQVSGGRLWVSAVIDTAIPAGNNNIGDVDIASITAGDNTIGRVKITDGTDVALVTAGGLLQVDASGVAVPVTDNSGSLTVDQGTASNFNAQVVGNIAHNGVDSGNPVKVGGWGVTMDGSDPGITVVEGDRTNLLTDLMGILLTSSDHPRSFSVAANYAAVQTNTEIKATPGAGLCLKITDIVVSNGATAGYIKFVEDTGGTPVTKVERLNFAANGGAHLRFQTPIRISANKNFGVTSVTADGFSVTISGYVNPD